MRRTTKKKKQKDFVKNINVMTNHRMMAMSILDSNSKKHTIRFLHEPSTDLYFVFVGKHNSSFVCTSYQMAERKYNYLVANS